MNPPGPTPLELLFHYTETRWWLSELERFEGEVRDVYEQFVEKRKQNDHDSLPFNLTLRAYVIYCFTWLDWASQYFSRSDTQTTRMADFLRRYMGLDGETARVVVILWRHTLAHGPFPRPRRHRPLNAPARSRNTDYRPDLRWQSATEEHLCIRLDDRFPDGLYSDGRRVRMMTLGLFNLIADTRKAIEQYVTDLDTSDRLQKNYEARWDALYNESFE